MTFFDPTMRGLRGRSLQDVRGASLLFAVVAAPLLAGCGDVACFEWTEAEGACPSQVEALVFFEEPSCGSNEMKSVDSEGVFDDGACCYAVTKYDRDNDYFGGDVCARPTGAGPSTSIGVGGVGGVSGVGGAGMGGEGGIGGSAVGGAGGEGGAGGAPACITCADAMSGGDKSMLCDASAVLFNNVTECTCKGACSNVCAEACNDPPVTTAECDTCRNDTMNGCGNDLNACKSDK